MPAKKAQHVWRSAGVLAATLENNSAIRQSQQDESNMAHAKTPGFSLLEVRMSLDGVTPAPQPMIGVISMIDTHEAARGMLGLLHNSLGSPYFVTNRAQVFTLLRHVFYALHFVVCQASYRVVQIAPDLVVEMLPVFARLALEFLVVDVVHMYLLYHL
jgi:hypothetical protein